MRRSVSLRRTGWNRSGSMLIFTNNGRIIRGLKEITNGNGIVRKVPVTPFRLNTTGTEKEKCSGISRENYHRLNRQNRIVWA